MSESIQLFEDKCISISGVEANEKQHLSIIKEISVLTDQPTKRSASNYELIYPLTIEPYVFVRKKPVAVLFGDERIEVKSWHGVYAAVLKRCNENPEHHKMLMYLRNKAAGKMRVFLSDSPDGMTRPLRIDEDMYGETHYGSQTLMHILVNRILAPAHFNCSNIRVAIKN